MQKKSYRSFILFLILTVLILCFIFGNSMQSKAESSGQSGAVMAWIKSMLPFLNKIPRDTLHHIIRKLAHLTEFCALGLSLGGLLVSVRRLWNKQLPFLALFIVLLTAVLDEFLQNFTGRASQVQDVLIDFLGAVIGLSVIFVINKLRERKYNFGE